MKKVNRIISSIVLVCFIFNTAVSDLAFGHPVNSQANIDTLSTPAITDDIIGSSTREINFITFWLSAALKTIQLRELDVDRKNFVNIASELRASLPFNAIHFFVRELEFLADGKMSVKVRVRDPNDFSEPRTYYAVFPLKWDSDKVPSIKVYTDEDFNGLLAKGSLAYKAKAAEEAPLGQVAGATTSGQNVIASGIDMQRAKEEVIKLVGSRNYSFIYFKSPEDLTRPKEFMYLLSRLPQIMIPETIKRLDKGIAEVSENGKWLIDIIVVPDSVVPNNDAIYVTRTPETTVFVSESAISSADERRTTAAGVTVDLSEYAGLPVTLDINAGEVALGKGVISEPRWERPLKDAGTSIANPEIGKADPDRVIYYGYRNVRLTEDVNAVDELKLRFDITVLKPGLVGEEFIMTKGHIHPGTNYPEIYEVWSGYALYVQQGINPETDKFEFIVTFAKPGDKVLLIPEYSHRTINIGKTPLVMANWISDEVGGKESNPSALRVKPDFSEIEAKYGYTYHVIRTLKGEIEFKHNAKYGRMPADIRFATPADTIKVDGLVLANDRPMYNALRDESVRDLATFLRNPEWLKVLYENSFIFLDREEFYQVINIICKGICIVPSVISPLMYGQLAHIVDLKMPITLDHAIKDLKLQGIVVEDGSNAYIFLGGVRNNLTVEIVRVIRSLLEYNDRLLPQGDLKEKEELEPIVLLTMVFDEAEREHVTAQEIFNASRRLLDRFSPKLAGYLANLEDLVGRPQEEILQATDRLPLSDFEKLILRYSIPAKPIFETAGSEAAGSVSEGAKTAAQPRDADGKFNKRPGKSPEDALKIITRSKSLSKGRFTLREYLDAYKQIAGELGFEPLAENPESTARRDLDQLVARGLLSVDRSKEAHEYILTGNSGAVSRSSTSAIDKGRAMTSGNQAAKVAIELIKDMQYDNAKINILEGIENGAFNSQDLTKIVLKFGNSFGIIWSFARYDYWRRDTAALVIAGIEKDILNSSDLVKICEKSVDWDGSSFDVFANYIALAAIKENRFTGPDLAKLVIHMYQNKYAHDSAAEVAIAGIEKGILRTQEIEQVIDKFFERDSGYESEVAVAGAKVLSAEYLWSVMERYGSYRIGYEEIREAYLAKVPIPVNSMAVLNAIALSAELQAKLSRTTYVTLRDFARYYDEATKVAPMLQWPEFGTIASADINWLVEHKYLQLPYFRYLTSKGLFVMSDDKEDDFLQLTPVGKRKIAEIITEITGSVSEGAKTAAQPRDADGRFNERPGKSPEDALRVITRSESLSKGRFTLREYLDAYKQIAGELGFEPLAENPESTARRDLDQLVARGLLSVDRSKEAHEYILTGNSGAVSRSSTSAIDKGRATMSGSVEVTELGEGLGSRVHIRINNGNLLATFTAKNVVELANGLRAHVPLTGFHVQSSSDGVVEMRRNNDSANVQVNFNAGPQAIEEALRTVLGLEEKAEAIERRAKEQEEIVAVIPMANAVGIQVAPPVQNYTIFASYGLLTEDEHKKDADQYGSRFGLERIMTDDPVKIADWVIGSVGAKGLASENVIVQLPKAFSDASYKQELEKLTSKNIKFIIVNTEGMTAEDKDARSEYRRNLYVMMLLARSINSETPADSSLYNLLRFFINSHMEDFEGKEAAVDDFMEDLKNNNIPGLIKVMLSYKPILRYLLPDYKTVAATLISA